MNYTKWTEARHPLTRDINRLDVPEMLEVLHQCDRELFIEKYVVDSPGLLAEGMLSLIDNLGACIRSAVKDGRLIALSGCGTSGRLGFLACHLMREHPTGNSFRYVIAGGDKALFNSVESCEDDAAQGKTEICNLMSTSDDSSPAGVLLVGITCSLSAQFVMGQLDYAMKTEDVETPFLVGFNNIGQLCETESELSPKTIATELHAKQHLINPVVGPEAICGSSRMKGGSATKMILDASLLISTLTSNFHATCKDIMISYKTAVLAAYADKSSLSQIINLASSALLNGGSVYYIGLDHYGLYGLLDASECVPTFGARPTEVQAFVHYQGVDTSPGLTAILQGKKDLHHFKKNHINHLQPNDFVIIIGDVSTYCQSLSVSVMSGIPQSIAVGTILIRPHNGKEVEPYDEAISDRGPSVVLRGYSAAHLFSRECNIQCPAHMLERSQLELTLKITLNCISTCMYVKIGKVHSGLMIDIKLSNRKLFWRAIGIVQEVAGVDATTALDSVQAAIYRNKSTDRTDYSVENCVENASLMQGIVPCAILIATGRWTSNDARMVVDNSRNVFKVLQESIHCQ